MGVGNYTTSVGGSNRIEVGTDASNGNGVFLTNGGVWTNGSSRAHKIDIKELEAKAAMDAVMNLVPVTYRGREDTAEKYVGFIAEDIPELVAMNSRKGIAAIEIGGVLAKVVQEQQKQIADMSDMLEKLESRLNEISER
ncbi:MAG: hypothetical protein GY762_00345 [Proteobacteria bacterium]|nr:hypothetical protein [Pseudomonadota bacterium]